MQPVSRTAVRSLRPLCRAAPRSSRRQASGSHGPESHGHHDAHHAAPSTETFGPGFFIALTAIPASLLIYKLTTPDANGNLPYFSRLIHEKVESYKTLWIERNTFHTEAVEQAAADRSLFLLEPNQGVRHVDLKFPEMLNASSPWNVPAGQGYANMDKLIAKYEKEAYEANALKHEQLKNGTLPAEQR